MTALTPETAANYDILIGIDSSASMDGPSARLIGKTRWQEARETASEIAIALAAVGLPVHAITFGGEVTVLKDQCAATIDDIFTDGRPEGVRLTHGMIAQALVWQRCWLKRTVAIILTDGAPDWRDLIASMLVDASNAIEQDDDLTFLFVQIGDDQDAAAWLASLDDLPRGRHDIVDTITAADALAFDPIALLSRAIGD